MKYVYLDSPLVRSLADLPETWNKLYDAFIKEFGRRFKPISSYYLFFEYIGFTKKHLAIPIIFTEPHFFPSKEFKKIKPIKVNQEEIQVLDRNLREIAAGISIYLKQKIYTLRNVFEQLIQEREKRISSFRGTKDLIDCLFGDIFLLVQNDFEKFVEYATTYLSWDVFCGIRPKEPPLDIIRERQLGFWLNHWEQGRDLPFGKIIDDQSKYYCMDFASPFKEFEDMVDSELHTYLILGYRMNGETHPIQGLGYPPKDPDALSKRNELALGTVNNIQRALGRELNKFPGKLYSLDPITHVIKETNEPIFIIQQ